MKIIKSPLLIIFAIIIRVNSGPLERIVNGEIGDISDFPYQLSLRRNNEHICGASVISYRYAITAAHCIDIYEKYPQMFSLRAGSNLHRSDGKINRVRNVSKHPLYNDATKKCDVALMRTVDDFDANLVKIIPLPFANEEVITGASATVSGWGYTNPETKTLSTNLRYIQIYVMGQDECSEMLSHVGGVTKSMFCAGHGDLDACQGDSGGPIKINDKLMGVVSWGIGCGDEEYPGVYARLSLPSIRNWIKVITRI